MNKPINLNVKIVLKVVFIIIAVFVGIKLWYLAIPALVIWYLYKKDKRFSPKVKLISSVVISVVFLLLGGITIYSERAPSLVISEPETGVSVQTGQVVIKGSVSPTKSKLTINSIPVEIDKWGKFSYNAKLKSENNSLEVVFVRI